MAWKNSLSTRERRWLMAQQVRVRAYDEIANLFANAPTQDEIRQFRLSSQAQEQISELLERNADGTLSLEEQAELDSFGELNLFLEYVLSLIDRQR